MFWGPNRWGCELNENVAPSPFKEFAAVATKTFASPRWRVINQSYPPFWPGFHHVNLWRSWNLWIFWQYWVASLWTKVLLGRQYVSSLLPLPFNWSQCRLWTGEMFFVSIWHLRLAKCSFMWYQKYFEGNEVFVSDKTKANFLCTTYRHVGGVEV